MSFKSRKLNDFVSDICHSGIGLSREDVVSVLSDAFKNAWELNYGNTQVKVVVESGGIFFYRVISEDKSENISLSRLSQKCISDIYDFFDKGLTKFQKDQEYIKFKDLEGTIVDCVFVTRSMAGYIVKAHGAQGVLDKYNSNEKFTDRGIFPCLLHSVVNNHSGNQLHFDRRSSDFIVALLKSLIPDVEKGVVVVKGVASIGGFETLIAVDGLGTTSPVGACLGYKGDRRKMLVDALNGERVRFIQWNDDIFQMIKNCFRSSDKILDIKVDEEDENRYYVVVDNDSLAEIIGSRGNNVKLVKYLLGISIQVCRPHELESGGMNSFEKLADIISKDNVDMRSDVLSILNKNNGDIPAILSNFFLDDIILKMFKKYYDENKENEINQKREEFVSLGGEEKLFMFIPEAPMDFYFKLLEIDIKTLDQLNEINDEMIVELSAKANLNLEFIHKILDYVYKNYKK